MKASQHTAEQIIKRTNYQDPRAGREGESDHRSGLPHKRHCREYLLSLAENLRWHVRQ